MKHAAHGFNATPQITDVHVSPVFHLGDGGLIDVETRGQLRLRLLACFAQLRSRHVLLEQPYFVRNPGMTFS